MRKLHPVAILGLLTALAIILGYVELLIPLPLGIFGVKLGLPNLCVIVTLKMFGTKAALNVNLARILLSALLFSNASMMLYSLAGGILSFIAMAICLKRLHFSTKGIGMAGGVFHNIGQLLLAGALLNVWSLSYWGILLLAGLIAGLLNGLIADVILRNRHRFLLNFKG